MDNGTPIIHQTKKLSNIELSCVLPIAPKRVVNNAIENAVQLSLFRYNNVFR